MLAITASRRSGRVGATHPAGCTLDTFIVRAAEVDERVACGRSDVEDAGPPLTDVRTAELSAALH